MVGCCIVQDDGDGDKGPEKVDVFGGITAAAPGDIEEVFGREAAAARFAVWVDVLWDYIMYVLEEGRRFRRILMRHDGGLDGEMNAW